MGGKWRSTLPQQYIKMSGIVGTVYSSFHLALHNFYSFYYIRTGTSGIITMSSLINRLTFCGSKQMQFCSKCVGEDVRQMIMSLHAY